MVNWPVAEQTAAAASQWSMKHLVLAMLGLLPMLAILRTRKKSHVRTRHHA